MDATNVIAVLSALAQHTRLEVFRMLVANELQGLAAGELARRFSEGFELGGGVIEFHNHLLTHHCQR